MGTRAKRIVRGDQKRAIAYLRVSTDRQEHGPEAQRAALERYAAAEGLQIVGWVEEKESGAATIEERPELQKALELLNTNGAGVLLAAKRDRLAREVTIARDISVRAMEHGGVVITADGMSDTEGRPDTFLKQGITDLFAEHERRQIADRTRAALAVMRSRGFRTGKVPFGFQVTRTGPISKKSGRPLTLIPNAGEQAVCALVMHLRGRGFSLHQIAEELEARGLVSRAGRPLTRTQVHRIVVAAPKLRELYAEHAGERFLHEPPQDEIAPLVQCARGHAYDAAHEGRYCCRGECRDGVRGDPDRRIEWR